jgi:hypothetical protein
MKIGKVATPKSGFGKKNTGFSSKVKGTSIGKVAKNC